MKAISTGNRYVIYDDTLKTYDKLPAKTYAIRLDPSSGLYLEARPDFVIGEKVYGVHLEKVDKILRSFGQFTRSLGVILSGDKGIGKSLFAKLLSISAVEHGLPVIIVDRFIPGIASYLESIAQEALVLFDEFDKTFARETSEFGEGRDPQTELLTLFDGMVIGKKLYVVTCNELRGLNEYLVNRPGRFHYHFRFDYPSAAEVREYLSDKLEGACNEEIEKVVIFASKVNLNYDCLRAIAFELGNGAAFEEAIQDLNILNLSETQYTVTLHFTNGKALTTNTRSLNLFDAEQVQEVDFYQDGGKWIKAAFSTSQCLCDVKNGMTIVPASALTVQKSGDVFENATYPMDGGLVPARMTITRTTERSLHYAAA